MAATAISFGYCSSRVGATSTRRLSSTRSRCCTINHCVTLCRKDVRDIGRRKISLSPAYTYGRGWQATERATLIKNRCNDCDEGMKSIHKDCVSTDSSIQNKVSYTPDKSSVGVSVAIKMVYFYKSCISPLMPKSCRFIPTCSSYSIQAFEQYGLAKGFLLTAWRITRCTPFGGKGYDPPRWPPVCYSFVGVIPRTNDRCDFEGKKT